MSKRERQRNLRRLQHPPAIDGIMLTTSPSFVGVFSFSRYRMSSSFTYTFTKLRSFPSSVYKCFRRSPYCAVNRPSASPTVSAGTSAESFFPANTRSGVGMITLTAMVASPFSLHRGALTNLNRLRGKLLPVIAQPPGSHLLRCPVHYADDHVAVPGPRMVPIVLAWPRWMIRMRVIPAYDLESLRVRRLLCLQHVARRHRKTVPRRIVSPINQRI